jgi:hypothetical protein
MNSILNGTTPSARDQPLIAAEPKLGVYHKAAYNCIWRARAHAHCGDVIERCHNSEIRTHILENRVLQLVRDVLCDPDKLRRCIEGPTESDSVERKKLRRRLTDIDKRVKAAEVERRRIISAYATEELSKDAYVTASTALDRELAALKRARADVAATQRLSKRTELDVRVRQFCERARACFERCDDFDTRRQFLLDHIERVVYHPRSVELIGSVPGDLPGSDETAGAVPFRIEGKMRRIKTLLGPRMRTVKAVQGGHLIAV